MLAECEANFSTTTIYVRIDTSTVLVWCTRLRGVERRGYRVLESSVGGV